MDLFDKRTLENITSQELMDVAFAMHLSGDVHRHIIALETALLKEIMPNQTVHLLAAHQYFGLYNRDEKRLPEPVIEEIVRYGDILNHQEWTAQAIEKEAKAQRKFATACDQNDDLELRKWGNEIIAELDSGKARYQVGEKITTLWDVSGKIHFYDSNLVRSITHIGKSSIFTEHPTTRKREVFQEAQQLTDRITLLTDMYHTMPNYIEGYKPSKQLSVGYMANALLDNELGILIKDKVREAMEKVRQDSYRKILGIQ